MFWLYTSLTFAEPITLQDAFALANQNNAQLKLSEWSETKAKLASQHAWLSALPQVKLEANWLYFDSPIEVSFVGDGDVDCTLFENFGFGDLCDSFAEPIVVREDQVYEGNLQIIQPLTPLYSIISGARAQSAMHQVAKAEASITHGEVMVAVTEAYMELQTMAAAEKLAAHTVERIELHAKRAQDFETQGLLTRLDVRQIEVGLQDAQNAVKQAQLGRAVAERKIELLLGKSNLQPQSVELPDNVPNFQLSYQTPQKQLIQGQLDAAKAGRQASAGQLLPTVALIAGITQNEGQGAFAVNEQQFVGITVSGDFQWGQKTLQLRQSHLDVKMAEAGSVLQTQQQALQQDAAIRQAELAHSDWLSAISKADLASDVRKKAALKFEQQMLSSAELMDFENDLMVAEMAVITAQKNAIVAIATVQSLLGLPVQPEKM